MTGSIPYEPVLFWYLFFPLRGLEACHCKILAHANWAFDKHAVRCKESKLLLLCHVRELVLERERPILKPAGVEETFQRQPAFLKPLPQLRFRWILQLDIPRFIWDAALVEPLFCLLAGGAFGVPEKEHKTFLLESSRFGKSGMAQEGKRGDGLFTQALEIVPYLSHLQTSGFKSSPHCFCGFPFFVAEA